MPYVPGPVRGLVTCAIATAMLAGCGQNEAPPGATSPAASAASTSAVVASKQIEAPQGASSPQLPRAVPGELLVKFKDSVDRGTINVALQGKQLRSVREYKFVPGLRRVKLAPGVAVEDAIAEYAAMSEVEYVEPNYILTQSATANDPSFASQWGLNNTGQTGGVVDADLDAPQAWDITTGSANVVVAVIDSGVDYLHQDLAANMFRNTADCNTNSVDDDGNGYVDDCFGIDAVNHDSDPMDDNGHGTHVAGIIGAVGNNGIGVAGVAWNVRILPCKFIGATGEGSTADAITCLDYIAALKDRGVNIVATNNSYGAGVDSRALYDAIHRQMERGILFIAAAGNESIDLVDSYLYRDGSVFPCAYFLPNVICVGASEHKDDYFFVQSGIGSNFGRQTVHVFAPGLNILSTLPGNTYGLLTGTSMAAPHVTGVAALLNSVPTPGDWKAVRNRIFAGGDKSALLRDSFLSEWKAVTGRRVNANGALTCTNTVVTGRMRPRTLGQEFGPISVGATVELAVLNINCAQPNGTVSVLVTPGNVTINLADNGAGTDIVAGDGIYSGTWTPSAAGNYELTFPGAGVDALGQLVTPDTAFVTVDGMLKRGFPVKALLTGGTLSGGQTPTVIGDIRGTGTLDILTTGLVEGPTYAWDFAGKPLPNFPRTISEERRIVGLTSFLSLGNVVGSPAQLEIIPAFPAGFLNDLSPQNGAIEVWSGAGALLPNFPRASLNSFEAAPTVVDVDHDGLEEFFIGGSDRRLYAFRHDGSSVPGFPLEVSGAGGDQHVPSPLAADLDADGSPELVLMHGDSLYVVHGNSGAVLQGFPLNLVTTNNFIFPRVAAIGDVDGDGEFELVGSTIEQIGPTDYVGSIVVFAADGTVKRKFPMPAGAQGGVDALADMNGDGIPEIISTYDLIDSFFHTYRRFVNVSNGFGASLPGWPAELSGQTSFELQAADLAVKVGDVDGDGAPEIVTVGMARLQALNADGTNVPGFPRPAPGEFTFHNNAIDPAIADLDGDGRNDIVLTSFHPEGRTGYFNKVWAYDLGGPASHGPIEWGQYLEGAGHRGYYETGKNLATQAYLTAHVRGDGSVASQIPGIACGTDCIERYAKGTSVVLTATAAANRSFLQWLGACAGQGNPCTVAVNSYTAATAVFSNANPMPLTLLVAGTGTGTVRSSPAGIDCPTDCNGSFPGGSTVTLTASAAANSYFAGWSGACTGNSTTCTLTMNAAKSVSANFEIRPVLTVTSDGLGSGRITSTPTGIDCGADCSEPYVPNTEVTLTATPAAGSVFSGWSGACTGMTCTTTITADTSVSANFALAAQRLTVTRAGTGSGSVVSNPAGIDCGTSCAHDFSGSTDVTLTATAAPDSVFGSWSGACSGTSLSCTVNMNVAKSVTATFVLRPVLTASVSGQGTISSLPTGIDCGADCIEAFAPDTVVRLSAVAAAGWMFSGWTGACSGSNTECSITMTANASVGATFVLAPRRLTLFRLGSGNGSVVSNPAGIDCGASCAHDFPANTDVTLTATPAPDSVFVTWSGACTGTSLSCTVNMSVAKGVSATLVLKPVLTVSSSGQGTISSLPAGITCGADCTEAFAPNTVVRLSAVAASGWLFSGWTGVCSGSNTECSITMTANTLVGATFVPVSRSLGLDFQGTGHGSVSSNPPGIACDHLCTHNFPVGTEVVLTATPEADSNFVSWDGACAGGSLTCTVRMDTPQSVTANFVLKPLLMVSNGGGGRVTSSPAGIDCGADCTEAFAVPATITLTATPAQGQVFERWSGACAGQGSTCTLNFAAATTTSVSFQAAPPPPPPPPPSNGGGSGNSGGGGGGGFGFLSLISLGVLASRRAKHARHR